MSSIPSQQVAETTAVRATADSTFRFARVVSDVLCPPVLAVPAMLLTMWLSGLNSTLPYAALYFVIAVVPPVLYVLYLVQSGQVQDFHLPERKERTKPFIASILFSLIAWGVLLGLAAPAMFIGVIFALIVQVAVLLAITLFWQISIHAATVAGFVTFATLATWPVLGLATLAWVPLLPLVGWSRLHLKRHTMSQIVIGSVVGVVTLMVTTRGLLW